MSKTRTDLLLHSEPQRDCARHRRPAGSRHAFANDAIAEVSRFSTFQESSAPESEWATGHGNHDEACLRWRRAEGHEFYNLFSFPAGLGISVWAPCA